MCSKSCFQKWIWRHVADLINSKAFRNVWKLLNLSDLQQVAKTFFKNVSCLLKNIVENKVRIQECNFLTSASNFVLIADSEYTQKNAVNGTRFIDLGAFCVELWSKQVLYKMLVQCHIFGVRGEWKFKHPCSGFRVPPISGHQAKVKLPIQLILNSDYKRL